MQVLKFGGTSVADAGNINRTISIIKDATGRDRTVVVASAFGGSTDALLEIVDLARNGDEYWESKLEECRRRHTAVIGNLIPSGYREIVTVKVDGIFGQIHDIVRSIYNLRDITESTVDMVSGFGEIISTTVISEKLASVGIANKWVDARELIVTERSGRQQNVVANKTCSNIRAALDSDDYRLYVVPGFVARDKSGRSSTLGRGGSDYTAALIAAALDARQLEIWTDVDGMMTADPRIVAKPNTIGNISYKEALELSHFGAKVIYPLTLQPVIAKNIPVSVKNTFAPERPGTLIEKTPPETDEKIKGISGSRNIALLSIEGSGMIGVPGYSSRLFGVLADSGINIILITQASSVHTMLVGIEEKDAERAKKAADELFVYEISTGCLQPLTVEKGFSIISLVGDDMKKQLGTAARMFESIAGRGINIRAIAHGSSEKNVSAIVSTVNFEEAVNAVHDEFFDSNRRTVNLFIAGYGKVAKALLEIIERRKGGIEEQLGVCLKVIGISNSKSMVFDLQGLHISSIGGLLSGNGTETGNRTTNFIDRIVSLKLKNSVFIDCTSSFEVSASYRRILSEKVRIVTCNKIANSMDMEFYKELHSSAKRSGISLSYETNVGAALPVISTIRQVLNSGDRIHRIEAAMSGSLNYIFNAYDGTRPFGEIVEEACALGYTEPDPRTDLQGLDLKRKALIIGREMGLDVEMEDIDAEPFLPPVYFEGSIEDFYKAVGENDGYFASLYGRAEEADSKPVCFFHIESAEIKVKLANFEPSHPFYSCRDSDNVIIIYSDFYPNGLTVKGAGAGAWQTASGLLANILE